MAFYFPRESYSPGGPSLQRRERARLPRPLAGREGGPGRTGQGGRRRPGPTPFAGRAERRRRGRERGALVALPAPEGRPVFRGPCAPLAAPSFLKPPFPVTKVCPLLCSLPVTPGSAVATKARLRPRRRFSSPPCLSDLGESLLCLTQPGREILEAWHSVRPPLPPPLLPAPFESWHLRKWKD